MVKFNIFVITAGMMVVWLVTGGLLFSTTNWKGTLSIALSGIFLNVLLAVYGVALERRLGNRSKNM